MKIQCFIIDDEPGARFILRRLLEKLPEEVEIIGEAAGLHEAKPLLRSLKPNLVFLDLEMMGSHGFDIFDGEGRPEFEVVITSAHADQALDAFGFGVADYLVKPLNSQLLSRAIQRVRKILAPMENSRMITFHTMEGTQIIPSFQIIRLEADRNYSWVHGTFGKSLCISKNLGSFESQLQSCGFFRVHHSHLISLFQIHKINRSEGLVEMKDGQIIPVSRDKKKRLLELLNLNNSNPG
jgi:two-component system LytT family response regulator